MITLSCKLAPTTTVRVTIAVYRNMSWKPGPTTTVIVAIAAYRKLSWKPGPTTAFRMLSLLSLVLMVVLFY